MDSPFFSILIANYNNGHFFIDCYKSIVSQTYSNWEVVIVDDSSTDNSIPIIKEIIGNDSRFKMFKNEENKGCGYTKRRCVELASGEICGFLDPDDALKNNALELMIKSHYENKNVAIISSRYEFVDLNMKFTSEGENGSFIPKEMSYLTYGKGAITHFATFKKAFYLKTEGINAKFKRAVDQDLYYKMEEVGGVDFIDEYLYNYRVNYNSISANENKYKARYWHLVAINDAYKRRKKTKINNFTKKEIKKINSDYYLKQFSRLEKSASKRKKIYFLIQSFLYYPTYKLKRKLKFFMLTFIK